MRILVADNNDALLEALRCFLWERGHEVEVAGNAIECMAALNIFRPDVLVLADDLRWGGPDGVIACMQDDATLATIPVLLLAHDGTVAASELPVRGPFRKPLRLGDLLVQLASFGEVSYVDVRRRAAWLRNTETMWCE